MARCWAAVPSPLQPKWPLAWIWQVLRTNDETFLRLSGVDATVYTRFLRACFFFAALHTCTTLVVILPIHYLLGSREIKKSDINRGSLTTLVNGLPEERADKILWVHMVMVIWITVSWMLLLTWFVLGSIRYRAYAARHVPAPASSRIGSPEQPVSPTAVRHPSSPSGEMSTFLTATYSSGAPFGPLHPEPTPIRTYSADDGSGPDYSLRCRTVMITNIPQNLRTPEMLRWYFARYLPKGSTSQDPTNDEKNKSKPWRKFKSAVLPPKAAAPPVELARHQRSKSSHRADSTWNPIAHELEMTRDEIAMVQARGRMLVENVVLAPKLSSLAKLLAEREQRMEELEEAHILLAKSVMSVVGKEIDKRQREEKRRSHEGELRRRRWLRAEVRQGRSASLSGEDGGGWFGAVRDGMAMLGLALGRLMWGIPDRSEGMDKMVEVIGPFVEEAWRRDAEYGVVPWFRGVVTRARLKLQEKQSRPSTNQTQGGEEETKGKQSTPERGKELERDKAPRSPTSKPASPTSLGNGHGSPRDSKYSQSPPKYDTVWSALYDLDPEYLGPYQPLTRRRSIFIYPLELLGIVAPTGLPSTDLTFLRIRSLQKRIEQYKTSPLPDASERRNEDKLFFADQSEEDSPNKNTQPHTDPVPTQHTIEAASSAFVTFRRWEDARRAARALAHRPGRPLTCLVVMAPQTTDLDWERLVKGKFAAQFVRDWLVNAAIWFFQIFWIFPISFITTLISIKSLEAVIPSLARFFDRNPKARSLITGLIPTLLVAGLGILIPVILFVIGRKAQTEVTFSGLHNGILIRYYKWLILNIVIFFCIGLSSFQTFLEAFRKQIPDPFQLVSSSFPAAAPFYAGWFILQTSLQNLMQFGLVGLPLITYVFGVRKASTPRKRKRGTQPRTIDYHYWTPNHLLAMHIIMIFAVLNPLVIPLGLIYYSVANVVFRNQLLRVYARRFYEGNGKMLTIRVLRYSMDGLALSHIVFLAFNLLNYNRARAGISGTLFGMTLILKILATREFRARYERLEDAESARLCGDEEPFLTREERASKEGARKSTGISVSGAPLAPERLNTFQSPVDSSGPSSISWHMHGLKPFGHRYNLGPMRNHPLRGRHKHKSLSLSRIVSRSGSQDEMIRPDTPASAETSVAAPAQPTRLLVNPRGFVQQVGQVPNMILEFVTGKPTQDSELGGVNYLCGKKPADVVAPGPKFERWDDTPNGSASYACPYYLDESPEWIWLPRDPSGPVDLDDTVIMYRLLLSVHDRDIPRSDSIKTSVNNEDGKAGNENARNTDIPVNRPPMHEQNSRKSMGPIPQSPMGTPGEGPAQATSYSSHASRPSMIRVRTVSADQASLGSIQSRRQSISDTMEMKNLQVPPRTSSGPEATPGGSASQPGINRRPSLLSVFRTRRGGEEGSEPAGQASIFSYRTAADGGESRQNTERRKNRAPPLEDVRRALDATVLAEEKAEQARKNREEEAEKLDDARVEQGESGGWSLVKKLILRRNGDE